MSKIYVSASHHARWANLLTMEGNAVRLDVTRDDFSTEQEFEFHFIEPMFAGYPLITNHDVTQPIKVRFETGDTQPKTIVLQLFDDDLVLGGARQGISIVPGRNTAEEDFVSPGGTGRWGNHLSFGIFIAEDDYPGVYASLVGVPNLDGPLDAMEGGQITFKLERQHETGRGEVFLKPADDENMFRATLLYGYDPADPFKVVWEEGDTEAKYLTINLPDDDIYFGFSDYMTWQWVPGENVSKIIGPDLQYSDMTEDGRWIAPVYHIDNDDMPTFGIKTPKVEVKEGGDRTFSFEVNRIGREFSGDSKAWVKLEGLGDNPADPARFGGSSDLIEVTFSYGETSKWITLNLPDDGTYQGTQQIKATITEAEHRWYNGDLIEDSPEGIGAVTAVTIYDNDPKPEAASYTTIAAHRFYNTANGTHFYTPSEAERDTIIATIPSYTYEGEGFKTLSSNTPGADELYRFYNASVGYHFFTASEAERDKIIASMPTYQFEGVGFYASDTQDAGMTAVYRFYNAQTGAHFMTSSLAERDNVITTYPTFQYEGVGFYVPTGDAVIA